MEFSEHWKQLEKAMENFKFKEDKSESNFVGAAPWEKTPDTKVDENPISSNAQNTTNGKKGKIDVEMVKQRVLQLDTKVDKLQMKEMELEKRCLEVEEEKERRVIELSEEMKVLKETFSNKMCEMQRDLLAMVEHCLNFENVLSQTKDENQKMRSQIKELVAEGDMRIQKDQFLGNEMYDEQAGIQRKPSVEESVGPQISGESSNKCRIVTVSSGSLGSNPSPSKSPPSVLDRQQVMPPSSWLRSTKIMWHHPTSAPVYTPGQSRPLPHGGFGGGPPFTVADQYHYPSAFYPYGQNGDVHHQNPEVNYYHPL